MLTRITVAAVMLAGVCATEVTEVMAGAASDTINALPEQRRADLFRQLLVSGGETCGAVTNVFFKGNNSSDNGAAYYAIRCDPGGDWMVTVQNGGNMATRVTSCAVIKLVGVECWTPF